MADTAADVFLDHFRIVPKDLTQDLVWEVGEAFVQLPYENLTKLIRKHTPAGEACRRRLPQEVIADHIARGTGGTCFSLTALFLAVLERLGYACRPALCDMRAGADTHCAVVLALPEGPHLMDPGYLLHRPLPLMPGQVSRRDTQVAEVRVEGSADGAFYEVYTGETWRYRLKTAAVSPARFVFLWEDSFDWTMMNNVHLSRALDNGYAYVHGHKLRLQGRQGKQTLNIRGEQARVLAERFGLDPAVVQKAYAIAARLRSERAPSPDGPTRDRGERP